MLQLHKNEILAGTLVLFIINNKSKSEHAQNLENQIEENEIQTGNKESDVTFVKC